MCGLCVCVWWELMNGGRVGLQTYHDSETQIPTCCLVAHVHGCAGGSARRVWECVWGDLGGVFEFVCCCLIPFSTVVGIRVIGGRGGVVSLYISFVSVIPRPWPSFFISLLNLCIVRRLTT